MIEYERSVPDWRFSASDSPFMEGSLNIKLAFSNISSSLNKIPRPAWHRQIVYQRLMRQIHA